MPNWYTIINGKWIIEAELITSSKMIKMVLKRFCLTGDNIK